MSTSNENIFASETAIDNGNDNNPQDNELSLEKTNDDRQKELIQEMYPMIDKLSEMRDINGRKVKINQEGHRKYKYPHLILTLTEKDKLRTLFDEIKTIFENTPPDRTLDSTYRTLIEACRQVQPPEWDIAQSIVNSPSYKGEYADENFKVTFYNHFMDAFARSGHVEKIKLLSQNIPPSTETDNIMMKAFWCASFNEWKVEPAILRRIRIESWGGNDIKEPKPTDLARLLKHTFPDHICYHTLFEVASKQKKSLMFLSAVISHWRAFNSNAEAQYTCIGEKLKNCDYLLQMLDRSPVVSSDQLNAFVLEVNKEKQRLHQILAEDMYAFFLSTKQRWGSIEERGESNLFRSAIDIAQNAKQNGMANKIKNFTRFDSSVEEVFYPIDNEYFEGFERINSVYYSSSLYNCRVSPNVSSKSSTSSTLDTNSV